MSRNTSLPNKLGNLRQGIAKRKFLLEGGALSVSPEVGESVIFTSGEDKEDLKVLAEHAEALSADSSRGFLGAEIVRQATPTDVIDVLKDTDVASMAFLGDGNFGTYNMFVQDRYERITWDRLSKASTHLKTGAIEERTCTTVVNPHKEIRVSLGSLVIADQTQIQGTVNSTFGNHLGFEAFNSKLHQLYPLSTNDELGLRQPLDFRL